MKRITDWIKTEKPKRKDVLKIEKHFKRYQDEEDDNYQGVELFAYKAIAYFKDGSIIEV